MMTRRFYSWTLLAVGMMFISSCREIKTTTEIFPDGSCRRTVQTDADSSEMAVMGYPFPQDSSWTVEDSTDTGMIRTKIFKQCALLDQELNTVRNDSLHIRIHITLKKKFRWFQTRFDYRETYEALDPFGHIPISEFMTPSEIALYRVDPDTLDLDDKVDEWLARNTFADFYLPFEALIKKEGDTELLMRVRSMKDSLYTRVIDDDNVDLSRDKMENSVNGLMAVLEDVLDAPMQSYRSEIHQFIKCTIRKWEFLASEGTTDFNSRVIMPGLILDTNADSIEGNEVVWGLEAGDFLWQDYTMHVASRLVNRRAMIVTVIFCILIIAGLIVGSFVRRKSTGINIS